MWVLGLVEGVLYRLEVRGIEVRGKAFGWIGLSDWDDVARRFLTSFEF